MAILGTFPGMVTPQVTGSTYQNMTPEEERRQWQLEDERKAKTAASNAAVMAQRNAEQQAKQDAENQARVREAFNQTYGPQLQRAYQDAAVQSAPTNTPAGMARDLAIGHGFTSGGTIGQPGTDITAFAAGKLPQPQMSGNQLGNTLDYMWRQQTDPYQRVANQMGGMMTMFHPANVQGAAVRGGGTPKKSTTKKQEVLPGGIDWQKSSGGGPGDFEYETLRRG